MKLTLILLLTIFMTACGKPSGGSNPPTNPIPNPVQYELRNEYQAEVEGQEVYLDRLTTVELGQVLDYGVLYNGSFCYAKIVIQRNGQSYSNTYHVQVYDTDKNAYNAPECEEINHNYWMTITGPGLYDVEIERIVN